MRKNQVAVENRIKETFDKAKALTITNEDQYTQSAEFLKKLKSTNKEVMDHFEKDYRKAKEAYDKVREERKRMTDIVAEAEKIIKSKMSDYLKEQERQRMIEEEKQRAKMLESQQSGEEIDITPEPAAPAPKVDKVSHVETWTFEIEDLDKIPREYLVPDMQKIRGIVKSMKGHTNIPGIKVVKDYTIRSGRA